MNTVFSASRSISSAISVFAIVALFAGAAFGECSVTLTSAIGAKKSADIQKRMEQARAGEERSDAPQKEIAETSNEGLSTFERDHQLNPLTGDRNVYSEAEAYFGSNTIPSPDYYLLPADSRALCLMAPATLVLMSDGITHHYASIDHVDFAKHTVTLLDPWAFASFLLAGHNVIGAKGQPHRGKYGEVLLELSFDDFLHALRGAVQAADAPKSFDVADKLYPELARTEGYQFWKYSSELNSRSFDAALMVSIALMQAKLPKLALLENYASDYTTGIASDFATRGFGTPQSKNPAEAKSAFIARVERYARELPWALRWALILRSRLNGDFPLRLAMMDSLLKADPNDVDFRIERARLLFAMNRLSDMHKELDSAAALWGAQVAASIAIKPAAKAIQAFESTDYGRLEDEMFRWRQNRIHYLQMMLTLKQEPNSNAAKQIAARIFDLGSDGTRIDYFGDILEIAWLTHSTQAETGVVLDVLNAIDPEIAARLSDSLYEHLTTREDIRAFGSDLRETMRLVPLGLQLCDTVREGDILPGQNPVFMKDLAAYCRGK
jgi:hypothetical protein